MSLPNFLKPSSPPRSPHVAPPSFFAPATSYFSGSNARPSHSTHPAAHAMLRPTKRDVLLCLVTLTFSFLFFSQPSTPSAAVDSPNSGHGIGGWSWRSSFSSSKASGSTGAVKGSYGEEGFSDTVRSVGLSSEVNNAATEDELAELAELKAGTEVKDQWDEEEEMEDDEFDNKVTILAGHQPGWTLFERLYLYNGSFYVVTDDPSDWPELRMMTSTGLPANNEPGNSEAREPNGDEIIYIKPHDAAKLWGPRVYKMAGTTWLFNDGQFIDHYYHFAAELLLGAWRAMASLDQDIGPTGETALPPPRRIWFLHQNVEEWRDKPKFNPTILFALFPSTSLLYPEDFRDIARASRSNKPSAYLLDRALLADRSAAFRGPWTGPTARTVASAMHVGETSRWWWEPIRRQILRYSGVAERIINRNLEGYGAIDPVNKDKTLATPKGQSDFEPLREAGTYKPLVTYISRQSSRRRLTKESHEELVKAVQERSEKVGFEFKVVEAEKLTQEEQFSLAARTTIMLGVHGNGLTHLLWMPPTPRSAVIEMFFTGGFARDYQWTAHALGIRHFGVQHDFSFTSPNLPPVDYPEGFQGTSITVVGKVVADLIEDRLAGRI